MSASLVRYQSIVQVIAACCFAGPTAAQSGGSAEISGVVSDSSGDPIVRVEIFVMAQGASQWTNAKGRFAIRGLPAGDYRLLIRRVGYQPEVADVELRAGGSVELQLTLERAVTLLPGVIVSARAQRLPRVYHRLESGLGVTLFSEDLAPFHHRTTDDLLRFSPRIAQILNAPPGCGTWIAFVDGVRTPPAMQMKTLPPPELSDFVSPSDIDAIEVFRSADFIGEEFLQESPDAFEATARRIGPITLGKTMHGNTSLTGTCRRIVLIWTKYYTGTRNP